jgi:hypothetical protein
LSGNDEAFIRRRLRLDGELSRILRRVVIARMQALLDSGVVHQISKSYVRAACTQELAAEMNGD